MSHSGELTNREKFVPNYDISRLTFMDVCCYHKDDRCFQARRNQ